MYRNHWYWFLVGLAAIVIVGAVALTLLPAGFSQSAILWLAIPVAALMIVGVVGWAYTETRHQEAIGSTRSPARRFGGYLEALAVTTAIAIGAALTPTRLAPVLGVPFILIGLVGASWRRRRHRRG